MDENSETNSAGPLTLVNVNTLRENLIATAVKFLLNPRVKNTTIGHKKQFLKKKGLSDEEIEIACQRAGIDNENFNNLVATSGIPYRLDSSRTSLWFKAKDIANMVALISIGSYSLYSLWKRYIAPRLFGTRSRREENYEKLLTSIMKLNENVVELKELIRSLQSISNIEKSKPAYEMQEVKNDLTTIKSMLLSRSQFPSSHGIPSWQMIGSTDVISNGENSEEEKNQRKPKSQESERQMKEDDDEGDNDKSPTTSGGMRKIPSMESNNGFHSGSSCEVVFVGGKNDSDPDHSDD